MCGPKLKLIWFSLLKPRTRHENPKSYPKSYQSKIRINKVTKHTYGLKVGCLNVRNQHFIYSP